MELWTHFYQTVLPVVAPILLALYLGGNRIAKRQIQMEGRIKGIVSTLKEMKEDIRRIENDFVRKETCEAKWSQKAS